MLHRFHRLVGCRGCTKLISCLRRWTSDLSCLLIVYIPRDKFVEFRWRKQCAISWNQARLFVAIWNQLSVVKIRRLLATTSKKLAYVYIMIIINWQSLHNFYASRRINEQPTRVLQLPAIIFIITQSHILFVLLKNLNWVLKRARSTETSSWRIKSGLTTLVYLL